METVILCGGEGLRMRPNTESLPKALVEVGGRPILWHIMKSYSSQGHRDFILCLGFKGEKIRRRFEKRRQEWKITFVDTGLHSPTGERIRRVKRCVTGENFFATYGDGLADVDLNRLLDFHLSHGRVATLTAVRAPSPFGMLELEEGRVARFDEKPLLDRPVNGGFFVFKRRIFDYIGAGETLEREVFARLVDERELYAYEHQGFWRCVDTFKDLIQLNALWKGNPAWKTW